MCVQLKKWSSLILFALAANSAGASQSVVGSDRQAAQVSVSARETNRIAIDGRRIANAVPAQPGLIEYKKDDAQGALYFTMTGKQSETGTVTLFVTDDHDSTYQLVLVPRPIGAEDIVIRPQVRAAAEQGARLASYQRRVKDLVLGMADQGPASARLDPVAIGREVTLWQEGRMVLATRYAERELVGEKYVLTNVSGKEMVLAEQELYRPGVLAVAVKLMTLAPGEATEIFVVRERRGHE
jgi:conjugal transfer pilus assembly protein TraK